jgi:hypothetical protein
MSLIDSARQALQNEYHIMGFWGLTHTKIFFNFRFNIQLLLIQGRIFPVGQS